MARFGILCKKLVKVYQDTPNIQTAYAVFEKDSKVYGVYGERTKLLLNFSLAVGDKAGEVGTVISVDYIDIDNVQHKRITIDYGTYNYQSYLVEGIGLSSTKYSANELNSYYEVLVSVYENGKCIFKNSDFTKQTTGIERTPQIEEKGNSKLLYLCTSNRKKASLVPKVSLHRRHIQVSIDVRRRSSMTTEIRARNEASGELKYQPSKHTQSMINYSITMRSVNSNLLIGSICHLLIVAYRPLLLYLRNPRAKPFMFGFYNQRFL